LKKVNQLAQAHAGRLPKQAQRHTHTHTHTHTKLHRVEARWMGALDKAGSGCWPEVLRRAAISRAAVTGIPVCVGVWVCVCVGVCE